MSTVSQTLDAALEPEALTTEQVVNLLRTYVSERIAQGQQPHDLTFALALVATEMGLFFTKEQSPLPVFQNVLQGVMCAVSAVAPENDSSSEVTTDEPCIEGGETERQVGNLH